MYWNYSKYTMIITIMFMFLKHPLSMGFNLIIQTTLVAMILNNMINSPWFSYILIFIMLGAMFVLFIYMASIASNEMMKLSYKMIMFPMIMMVLSWFVEKKWILKTE